MLYCGVTIRTEESSSSLTPSNFGLRTTATEYSLRFSDEGVGHFHFVFAACRIQYLLEFVPHAHHMPSHEPAGRLEPFLQSAVAGFRGIVSSMSQWRA